MTGDRAGKSLSEQAAAGAKWSATGMACMSVCGYLNAVMLARGLGPAAFGIYGVVYSVLLASEQILRFGVPQSMTRLVGAGLARDPSRLEATGVWLVLAVNLVSFVILWVAAPWAADWLNLEDGALYLRIAILDLPFFGVYRVLMHVMSGRGNFRASSMAICIYAIARTAGVATLWALGDLTIGGALIVNAAASVMGVLVLAPQVGLRSFRPTLSERRTVITTAAPITVGDVAIQGLLAVDLWLLSAMGVALAAGVRGEYVAALSLARGPNIASHVLVGVLVPLISRAEARGDHGAAQRLVTGTTRFLLTLALPACALIAANAGELLVLFFGDSYGAGAPELAILAFAQGFGFTVLACLQAIMVGIGLAAVTARYAYVALASAIALNLVLVPILGPVGAALASMLGFTVANALVGQAIWRRMGALLEARRDLMAVAVTIAVSTVSWFLPFHGVWVVAEMAAMGVACLAISWWLGLIDRADVALLRGKSRGPTEG